MIISAISSNKNFSYKGFPTISKKESSNYNTNFLAGNKTPQKHTAKKIVKWLTIGLGTIATGLIPCQGESLIYFNSWQGLFY